MVIELLLSLTDNFAEILGFANSRTTAHLCFIACTSNNLGTDLTAEPRMPENQ